MTRIVISSVCLIIIKFAQRLYAAIMMESQMPRSTKRQLKSSPIKGSSDGGMVRFAWHHEGDDVRVCGSFTAWKPIPMQNEAAGNSFSLTLLLPCGFHKYKYLVDHEWTYDPDQPTVVDSQGHVNNWLYIPSEQDAQRESGQDAQLEARSARSLISIMI